MLRIFREKLLGRTDFFPKVPLAPGNCVLLFSARKSSKCPRPRTGQNSSKAPLRPPGGPTLFPRKLRKPIPDNVVPFFFEFGTPSALRTRKGPVYLACCLLLVACRLLLVACLLLDAQAPPWWSNNLINRLKYYVLQLGDPNPNQDWVLGPS